jgi:hypothetical protein
MAVCGLIVTLTEKVMFWIELSDGGAKELTDGQFGLSNQLFIELELRIATAIVFEGELSGLLYQTFSKFKKLMDLTVLLLAHISPFISL